MCTNNAKCEHYALARLNIDNIYYVMDEKKCTRMFFYELLVPVMQYTISMAKLTGENQLIVLPDSINRRSHSELCGFARGTRSLCLNNHTQVLTHYVYLNSMLLNTNQVNMMYYGYTQLHLNNMLYEDCQTFQSKIVKQLPLHQLARLFLSSITEWERLSTRDYS